MIIVHNLKPTDTALAAVITDLCFNLISVGYKWPEEYSERYLIPSRNRMLWTLKALKLCLNMVLKKAHKTWTVNLTRVKQSSGKIDKGFGVFSNICFLIIFCEKAALKEREIKSRICYHRCKYQIYEIKIYTLQ